MVELLLAVALSVSSCSGETFYAGDCEVSELITGEEVTLEGLLNSPTETPDDPIVDIEGGSDHDPNTFCMDRVGELTCWSVTPPAETGSAPVTLADIARFRPEVGAHVMEPSGWAIEGLPSNFVSAASAHAVDGELFGTPATVRFTPIAWRWDYGDGSTSAPATGGSRWADIGAAEFSPTATSHAYGLAGRYRVTLTVEFRAEYRVGTGAWTSIAGSVPIAATPLDVTVARATTVLVDKECNGRTTRGCS